MSRLDEVISKYAMMQDKSEEGERQKRRARLLGTNPSGSPKASLDSGEVRKGSHLSEVLSPPCTGHQGFQGAPWSSVWKQ